MTNYMLDTVIFNRLLENNIALEIDANDCIYVTHIQYDELCNTSDCQKRESLLKVFSLMSPQKVSTNSSIWDVSSWGDCEWTDDESISEQIQQKMDECSKDKNNPKDSLIAETAIKNKLILVTEYSNLANAAKHFGCECMNLDSLNLKIGKFDGQI